MLKRTLMPKAVAAGRLQVCKACPTPCTAFTAGQIDHAKEAACCALPSPRWRSWLDVQKIQHARKTIGLGDVVAAVAQPIARAVDAVAGTDLEHCVGCGKRKGGLNDAVPDVTRPFRRKAKG